MSELDHSLISELPLFAGLRKAELDEILDEARPLHLPKNARAFEQGEDAHSFFVLLHGHIRAAKTTVDGQQVIVRFVTPGETFGVAVAIGVSAYPATATAVDDSLILVWPSEAWPRLIAKCPALSATTLHVVGERLHESHTRIIEMSTQQVDRRVARALLRLVRQAGRKTESGIEIDFPITRQDIAEMTGTTNYSVSRVLSTWEGQGVVEGHRQRIIVRNPKALAQIADK
jgi:CRP-like cAMP-binding protein